ncbi:hypothetical protein DSUL_100017 [Desulfovibrionales bacterium]
MHTARPKLGPDIPLVTIWLERIGLKSWPVASLCIFFGSRCFGQSNGDTFIRTL